MNDLAIGYTFRPLIPGSRPFISTDVGSITEYFVIVNAFLTVAYTRKLLIHFVSNFGVHPLEDFPAPRSVHHSNKR